MDPAEVAAALTAVRTLLAGDGGDVELVAVEPATGTVRLRLLLRDAGCAECLMPRPYLEQVAADVLRRSLPELRTVTVDDPRDSSPGAVPGR